MLQNDQKYHQVHSGKLSHSPCVEPTFETQNQAGFYSADSNVMLWNVVKIDHRHQTCCRAPSKRNRFNLN